MNSSQFLDQVLGDEKGWVSVAFKKGDTVWNERQFEWPAAKAKLIKWAELNGPKGDIFICPAVRLRKERTKGQGKGLQWLWADVDMEKIPTKKHEAVAKRIDAMGTIVVASGSGSNRHVYVKLDHEVTAREHEILNTGLRDFLMADNKQADNSLLRLPGTINHKPGNHNRVGVVGGHGKSVDPEYLMEKPTWQAVEVAAGSPGGETWAKVDVSKLLKGSLKAMLTMQDDEAKGRYGSRHKAVYAVTRELIKRGLNSDQVHTLMDQFAPAISKNKSEHSGYDVHRDVARVMQRQPTTDVVEVQQDPEEDGDIPEDVQAIIKRRRATKLADQYEAQLSFQAPPPDIRGTAAHYMSRPPEPVAWLIDGIAGEGHTITITGQYKTGKSLFALNLARSLADRTLFLDHFPVHMPSGGTVDFWSCEMTQTDTIDGYVRPQQMEHPERLHITNLRGYGVNLLTDVGKQYAINMLQGSHVKVWIIDSFARIASMAGVDENDNGAVRDLMGAINEIKRRAEVKACFIIAHTPRQEFEEGEERARGAGAIDEDPDCLWVLTNHKGTRALQVKGRSDAFLEKTSLDRDEVTKRLAIGIIGTNKAMIDADNGIESVVEAVHVTTVQRGKERIVQRELVDVLTTWKVAGGNRSRILALIQETVDVGRIVDEAKAPGASRRAGVYYRMPPEGTVTFDFSKVGHKPVRKRRKRAQE